MGKKILIVGGVAGGAGTAARLRRMDETAEIIMFERGKYISFANCGLPYYIGGTIKQRDALLLQTPEGFNARFNVDVRTENEVLSIDKENKKVMVMDRSKNVKYEETYDVLVLSPGSTPIKPKINGIDAPNIFSLWNVPDTDMIKSYIEKNNVKKATVIGAGFIGIEMAENLYDLGIQVSIAEMADQVMAPVDMDMAQILHEHMASKGIDLHLNNGVKEFIYKENSTYVVLNDDTKIDSDLVILSIGIIPNGELAKTASLDTNKRGGIIVDEYLKTTDDSIYALGDAIEVIDFNTKGKIMVPLAGPANKQARIVADNICGEKVSYKGTQGTSVAKVFDLTVASTGLNEKALQKAGKVYGKDYQVAYALPKSHAGYYPGAFPMTVKLVFGTDGKVLGGQIVGIEGVDKRVDVLATTIRFGGNVQDLIEIELSYAPPYSSAKDPVNMVGYVADNILNGNMVPMRPNEIKDVDLIKTIIVDVREQEERDLGYIEDSILIPVNTLRDNLDKLDKEKEIVIYCAVGQRGHVASRILMQNGFKVKNLMGGYTLYKTTVADYTQKGGYKKEEGSKDDEVSPSRC